MARAPMMRLVACIVVAVVVGAASLPVQAQSAEEFEALDQQILQLYREGKYAEATDRAQQVLAARERVLGLENPTTLSTVNVLAGLYLTQSRYAEAESHYRRVLAVRERVLGPEHADTLASANALGAGRGAFRHARNGQRYGAAV